VDSVFRPHRLSVWPTLPPTGWQRRPGRLPFPLGEAGFRLYSRARHGLWQGVGALGLGQGDAVLAPAYHHGSEIEALQRAGMHCRFYEVEKDLQPEESRLEELLSPDVRALYLIHYFGVPQAADRWRQWCDRHDLLLIEDAAMAFLATWDGRPVGSFGHLAIFCLYKSFALPDGGAMICSAPSTSGPSRPPRASGLGSSLMRTGSWLAQRSRFFSTLHGVLRGRHEPDLDLDFELGDPATPATRMTSVLVPRLIDPAAAEQRRSNYRFLAGELGERLPLLFPSIPDGSSPIALMFRLGGEEQRTARRELRRRGVRLDNFWLAPHPSVPEEGFERSRSLRSSVVGLPVHQELRSVDLDQIVTSVKATIRSSV
jgi:dTDP-4-amino-4,6-dideoxygalactose transaminase